MNLEDYQNITGNIVPTGEQDRVAAVISKVQRYLERLLGYTLDTSLINTNEYAELGKTTTECPCPDIDLDALDDPDEVVTAYRLFTFNKNDKYYHIDPCTAINAVKLVNNFVTFKTLESYEYRPEIKNGIITYLEKCEKWCFCASSVCNCTQLAVDADWLTTIPDDLLDVWAELVTYESDLKRDIKSETLGTHSYTKATNESPILLKHNTAIIKKYLGGNGSMVMLNTI